MSRLTFIIFMENMQNSPLKLDFSEYFYIKKEVKTGISLKQMYAIYLI